MNPPPSSSFPPPSTTPRASFTSRRPPAASTSPRPPTPPAATAPASVAADARPVVGGRISEPTARPRCPLQSKSSSAVPTLSTTSVRAAQRFLPTYWLPTNMTAAGGANPTAVDLLRQTMMQR